MAASHDSERGLEPLVRSVLHGMTPESLSACPDAETLAAWSEGALERAEVEVFERHAADCARCRAMMAAFIRSGAPAVAAVPDGGVAVPFWRRWRWQWIVPITATATALALYIAVPEPPLGVSGDTDRTAVPRSSAESAAPTGGATAVPSADLASQAVTRPAEPGPVQSPTPPFPPERQELGIAAKEERAAELDQSEPPSAPAPDAGRGFSPVPSTAAIESSLARSVRAEEAGTQASPDSKVDGASPQQSAPPPGSPAPVAPRMRDSARTALQGRRTDASAESRALGASGSNVAPDQREREATIRRLSLEGGAGMSSWRINGTSLERSDDGQLWAPAVLPAGVDASQLSTGAVAGPSVWFVGAGGLVLVAPDGRTFRRATAPTRVDLERIEPRDARVATAFGADGRRFETADAGSTWR